MNETPAPAARGDGAIELLVAMAETRLQLAANDVEAHLQATLEAIASLVAAFVLGLVALTFTGVAIVAAFWDTHRVVACVSTTLAYVLIAFAFAAHARSRWQNRPPAFEQTLRELQLDREAVVEAM